MQTIEYRKSSTSKAHWGHGPWLNEVDKKQWRDHATALPCLIVRNQFGVLCGYVGVTSEHHLFGVDDMDSRVYSLRVHGGITFAGPCGKGAAETSICHIVDPGEPDQIWWLGFDCGHCHDLSPGLGLFIEGMIYRDISYVERQCRNLATQLAPPRLTYG